MGTDTKDGIFSGFVRLSKDDKDVWHLVELPNGLPAGPTKGIQMSSEQQVRKFLADCGAINLPNELDGELIELTGVDRSDLRKYGLG